MLLRSCTLHSRLAGSLLVCVILVAALGHLAAAQSGWEPQPSAALGLAATAAHLNKHGSTGLSSPEQRRRLQQRAGRTSQAQPAVYLPFDTNSGRTNRPNAASKQPAANSPKAAQAAQAAQEQSLLEEPAAPAAPVAPAAPAKPEITVDMSPQAASISPSVLLEGRFDWENIPDDNGRPWSRCLDMVWRARRLSRGNKLNFVPTHHWIPREDGFGVSRFCYIHKDPGVPDTVATNNGMYCSPWNDALIKEFEDTMTSCLAEAMRQGFTPYIRPHLDDGLAKGIWRNGLMFGPSYVYGGYSYKQIMLDPLARALNRALAQVAAENKLWPRPDRTRPVVYLALQGEMSATLMRYTAEWQALIPGLRATIGSKYADAKIGVGLNFNALDAVEGGTPPANGGLIGWLVGSGARASRYPVPNIDAAAVNKLVSQDIDFIGISAYAPYTGPGMQLNEFENSAFNVGESLKLLANGVDLAALIDSGKLELHYSEFGLGGGDEGNARPASSARMAGKEPWAGVAGSYNSANDPWNVYELRTYRDEFFTKALQWLSDPDGRTYKVCDVFVWGMASWDLFGVYPDSTAYRGLTLVQKIADHNMLVITAQANAAQGSDSARLVLAQLQAISGQPEGIVSTNVAISPGNKVKLQASVNYNAPGQSYVPAPADTTYSYNPPVAPQVQPFPFNIFGR